MNTVVYKDKNLELNMFKAWTVCIVSSLFFFYEFIQINLFNSINNDVIRDFHLNATQLGFLSACYFYSTVFFLLPAGQILDRFSAKKVILITLALCIVGIIGFALSKSVILAAFFRFIEGIGSAFCFLGSFRIAARWFPSERMAFVTGIIVTIGMIGGIVAQTPLSLLVEAVGWRKSLFLDASLGLFFALLIFNVVKDSPNKEVIKFKSDSEMNFWLSMRLVYFVKQNWFCGLYTCLVNLPLVLLGALWGDMFLEQSFHFSHFQATNIITMIFLGTIVGSPLVGYISDYIGQKRMPMIIGAFLTGVVSLCIIYSSSISYDFAILLFFLLGLFSSSQILGYPAAVEGNSKKLSGMSSSIVSFVTMSGYIIFQPFFGLLMDLNEKPTSINGVLVYSTNDYHNALLIIPVSLLIAVIVSICIKTDQKKSVFIH